MKKIIKESIVKFIGFIDAIYHLCIYEWPSKSFRKKLINQSNNKNYKNLVNTLCKDGCLIIPEYFFGSTLIEMKKEFEQELVNKEKREKEVIILDHESLRNSFYLSIAAIDPFLISIAEYYWGKPIKLSQSLGTRL